MYFIALTVVAYLSIINSHVINLKGPTKNLTPMPIFKNLIRIDIMQILLNFKSLRKDTLSLIFCRPLQTAKRKEYQCQYPCIYI